MENKNYQAEMSEILYNLRKSAGLSQEALAGELGVSVQTVINMETGESCPEIQLLPLIADVFNISIDELFGRTNQIPPVIQVTSVENVPWDDDGTLHGVVYIGRRLLKRTENLEDFTFKYEGEALNVHALCNISCGDVQNNVDAGTYVNCKSVGGNVKAGTHVSCTGTALTISAGTHVNCGDVGGDVNAGTHAACNDVAGNVRAGTSVKVRTVRGEVKSGF